MLLRGRSAAYGLACLVLLLILAAAAPAIVHAPARIPASLSVDHDGPAPEPVPTQGSAPAISGLPGPTPGASASRAAPTEPLPDATDEPTEAPLTPPASPIPTATASPEPQAFEPATPLAWYRAQGGQDAGVCAPSDCGPAAVAMAVQYALGNTIPVADVRQFISGDTCRGTDFADVTPALDHWDVGWEPITGMQALNAAVNERSHIVLAILDMESIAPGADYLVPGSDPAQRYGRFHDYTSGHFVVVKGITADNAWVIVEDPYVFTDQAWGFYADGEPKGRDRYFPYDEFVAAYQFYGSQGVEIVPQ